MPILLRIVGAVWILLAAKPVWLTLNRIVRHGIQVHLGLNDLLYALMMAGGIGLLFLKEWGRWCLLAGAVAFLLILAGPSLLHLQFGPAAIRQLVFYGIFIILLLLPQARGATRK